jgi:hypothetical protein
MESALCSGAVALGTLVILFLSACLFFSGVNDGYYSESYGPGFVEALKGDRMSLYSADLLRSDSLFYWFGRSLLFIKIK